jgi:hypothetical protein
MYQSEEKNKLIKAEQEQLWKKWVDKNKDIMLGVPNVLPPIQDINHKISLIDESKVYNYHLSCCLDVLKLQLNEKIKKYIEARWWVLQTV